MNFIDPQSALLQFGLKEGMRVADFGAGPGHTALALAKIVGDDGTVFAVDVQEELLKRLRADATEQGVGNVEAVWANVEDPKGTRMRDNILDAAVLSNTLFQLEDKEAAIKEIQRVLKPKGRLLVIDWAGSYGGIGPKSEHVIEEHEAERLFLDAGMYKEKAFRPGPHHWALIFSKPS